MMRMLSTPSRLRPERVDTAGPLTSTGEPVDPTHSSMVLVAPVPSVILATPVFMP